MEKDMSKEKQLSPITKCMWAHLQKPNISNTGEYKDSYQITLVLDPKDSKHKDLLTTIANLHKSSGSKVELGMAKHPIKIHKDEAGNAAGKYEVRFKTEYGPVPTFDAKGQPIIRDKNFVANDSEVRISFSHSFYKQGGGGVSLFLNSVQVINLIEWQGGTAEDYGFTEEEGYSEFLVSPEDAKKAIENDDFEPQTPAQKAQAKIEEPDDLPF
jgi:hypothetical protein